MVDSINPAGQIQNTQSVRSNAQKNQEAKSSDVSSANPVDDVQISQEALSIAQAQEALSNVTSQLSSQTDLTLSDDVKRLDSLA